MKTLLAIGLWLTTLAAAAGDGTSLTLAVEEAAGVTRTHWPARGGVPFGRGQLRDPARVRLLDGGREIPLQRKVLAVWPDGSVRWLLVDFLADVAAGQIARYRLEYGEHARANGRPQLAVSIRREAQRIWMDTGALCFALDTKAFRGIQEVTVAGGGPVVGRGGALRLVKDTGKEFRADLLPPEEVTIEDDGPVCASVKVAGWFAAADGEKFCSYEARLFAWAGRQDVRCDLTWIFTGDPEEERIRELSVSLRADVGAAAAFGVGLNGGAERRGNGAMVLFQKDWKEFELNCDGQTAVRGQQWPGWVELAGGNGRVGVMVRDAWQQFPKSCQADAGAGELRVGLWPAQAATMDLRRYSTKKGRDEYGVGSARGLAKTHQLFFDFGGAAGSRDRFRAFQEPLAPTAGGRHNAESLVFGAIGWEDRERFGPVEAALEAAFDWDRAMWDWPRTQAYGIWNYADLHFDWNEFSGWGQKRFWFNNEYGAGEGPWLMWFRSGKRKYLRFAEVHSRHLMDVDTIHWPPESEQFGGQHIHNVHQHWADIACMNHNYPRYAVYDYLLTGNRRALEVAREQAQFIVRWWDATQRRLAETKRPLTFGPDNRTYYNVFRGLAPLYEIEPQPDYLRVCRELFEHLHAAPLDDVAGHWHPFGATAMPRYAEVSGDPRVWELIRRLTLRARPAASEASACCYDHSGDERIAAGMKFDLMRKVSQSNWREGPFAFGEMGGWWLSSKAFFLAPYAIGALQRAGRSYDSIALPADNPFCLETAKPRLALRHDTDGLLELIVHRNPGYSSRGYSSGRVRVLNTDGRELLSADVGKELQTRQPLRIPTAKKGIYLLDCEGNGAWSAETKPNAVMFWLGDESRLVYDYYPGMEHFFRVPSGCREFAVRFTMPLYGGMGARVFRPDGSLAGQFALVGPGKSERKLAVNASDTPTLPAGVWKLQVRCFRTLAFSFEGLPRFVAVSPERAFAIDEKHLPPR